MSTCNGRIACMMASWLVFIMLGSAKEISLTKMEPEKILYKPGEKSFIQIAITNAMAAEAEVRLLVEEIRELDQKRTLFDGEIILPAAKEITRKVHFYNGDAWYGREVAVSLFQKEQLLDERSEYFQVIEPLHVARVGIHSAWSPGGCASQFARYLNNGTIERMNRFLREHYINIVEYFGFASDEFAGQYPFQEDWTCGQYKNHRETVQRVTDGLIAYGIKPVVYYWGNTLRGPLGAEFWRQYPQFASFRANGKPSGSFNVAEIEAGPRGNKPYKSFICLGVNTYYEDAMRKSAEGTIRLFKELGISGYRWDHPVFIDSGAYLYDGRKVGDLVDAPAETLKRYQLFMSEVRKAVPDFVLLHHWTYEGEGSGAEMAVIYNKALYPELAKNSGALMWEEPRGSGSPASIYHHWDVMNERTKREADKAREFGGCFYNFPAAPYARTEVGNLDGSYCAALYGAAGAHLWFAWAGYIDRKNSEERFHEYNARNQAVLPYHRYMTRYSAFLWDNKLKRLDKGGELASVNPAGKVWWENYVFARDLPEGKKQIILHLINKPPKDTVGLKGITLENLKEVDVKLKAPDGYQVKKIWVLTPDELPLRPKEIKSVKPAQSVAFKIENLHIWKTVVAEVEK